MTLVLMKEFRWKKIIPKLYLIKSKDVKQTLHHIPPQKYIGFVSSHFLVRGFCKNCQLYDESLFCCSSLLDGCKLLPFLFEIMLQHEKGITDIHMSTSLNSSHRKNTVAQRIFTFDIPSLGVYLVKTALHIKNISNGSCDLKTVT